MPSTFIPSLAPLAGDVGLGYRITSPLGDEIQFNQGHIDENSVEFYASRLDGWDSPDVRDDTAERPRDHGLYLGDFFYGGRPLTLSGWLLSPNGIEPLRLARERLVASVDNLSSYSTLHVAETAPKQAQVRRAGRVGLKQTGRHLIEFDIALIAPDPRRYSEAARTVTIGAGQTVQVQTFGTFADGPHTLLTLTPGGAGMSVVENTTGQLISCTAGAPIVCDSDAGTVAAGTSLAWGRMASTQTFFTLPPSSVLSFTATGGTATLTFRDAWS